MKDDARIVRFPGRAARRISARVAYRRPDGGTRTARARPRIPCFDVEVDCARGLGEDYRIRLAKGQIARIRLERLGPFRAHIDWVYVPPAYRGEGFAGQIMTRVLRDADREQVTITLEARACAGLSQEALERWYLQFGFANTGQAGELGGVILRREALAAEAGAPRIEGQRRAA